MRATLISRTDLSPTVATFSFQPERPVSFLAGQYIELIMAGQMDDRGDRRWFTITSSPQSSHLDLTMRLPRRMSTFKRALCALPMGSPVQLGEVLGDFVAPKLKRTPLIFVADGIGLTPFISIIRDLDEHHDRRTIELFHTARNAHDHLYYDEFARFGVMLHTSTSRYDAATILSGTAQYDKPVFYLAGTEDYCEGLQQELKIAGVSSMRIALDYLTGYPEA